MKTPEQFLKEKCGESYYLFPHQFSKKDIIGFMEEYADQFKNPPKKTIEERFQKFHDDCNYFVVGEYTHEMVTEFVAYWTEHSKGAKKMRFEKEKVFDIKKRLERWKRNQKPNYGKSEPVDRDKQLADYINRPR